MRGEFKGINTGARDCYLVVRSPEECANMKDLLKRLGRLEGEVADDQYDELIRGYMSAW